MNRIISHFLAFIAILPVVSASAEDLRAKAEVKIDRELPADPESNKAYFEKVRLMYEMATLALQTDSTRLVTLFLSSATTPAPPQSRPD